MSVQERYRSVAQSVASVAEEQGRDPQDVRVVAVSKTVGLDAVAAAAEAGARDFGENRPDELMVKADRFPELRWHFIGNIQSRRIRDIVGRATLIHSLFEERHAQKIGAVAQDYGLVQDVLIEVNVSGEESKSGIRPAEAQGLLEFCETLPALRVRGLMTMAPQGDIQAQIDSFTGLAALSEALRATLPPQRAAEFTELSMGMSEDWPIAIAHGATMVRIGRAIFSEDFTE